MTKYLPLLLSGLKVPTTITLTLRGQPSRITTLSPMGPGAALSEEPTAQALSSSSQVSCHKDGGCRLQCGELSTLWACRQTRFRSRLGVCSFGPLSKSWIPETPFLPTLCGVVRLQCVVSGVSQYLLHSVFVSFPSPSLSPPLGLIMHRSWHCALPGLGTHCHPFRAPLGFHSS